MPPKDKPQLAESAIKAESAIEVKDVTKIFGSTVAARNISLSVAKGEFFSFLGPSGCGKTTVLRMIAGFESPSSGQIFIEGKNIISMPPHKRPVNMVFQSYALFPHLTVLDNICFGLRFAQLSKADVLDKAKRALSLVRLEHLAERFPSQLSGGQQQRIALARAIVKEPAVLLLDEPLSALDPQIREEMQTELARLQRELNMTFIMVTHDQDEALALSHRIAVFCLGNLEQVGTPEEVYSAPATKFVAQFIGRTNLLPCTYVQSNRNRHCVKLTNGTVLSADADREADLRDGETCYICIKPHAVKLQLDPGSPGAEYGQATSLRAIIRATNYKGTCTEYLLDAGGMTLRAELQLSSETSSLTPGSAVVLTFNDESAWLLKDQPTASSLPQKEPTAV